MNNIIPVLFNKHNAGPAKCLQCGAEWDAIAPKDTVSLECPECGTLKGVWKGFFDTPEPSFVCDCGNDLFFVGKQGIKCCKCGTDTNYSDLCN